MIDKQLVNKNITPIKGPIFVLVFLFSFIIFIWPVFSQEIKDLDITLAIDTQLRNDESVPSHMIDMITKDGIVKMTGSVDNLLARQRAAKVAETVKGVRAVVNEIEVRPTVRTDEQIRVDIEQALQDDPATDIYKLSVTVQNGVVSLNGRLGSWHEEELCVQVAKGVKGVRQVIPNFNVLMKLVRSDSKIAAEIERRLSWDVWVDEAMIEVKVIKGDVFLSGIAVSLAEKTRAYRDSWIAGVRSVNNDDLLIDWSKRNEMRRQQEYSLKSDEGIRNAIKDAFSYDPRVSPFNLNFSVNIGEVTLTGCVSNLKAKRAAEQDAKNTVGVWRVKNHLKVRPSIGPNTNIMPAVDTEIARRVRTALLWNSIIHQHTITVSVSNGMARLGGSVDSKFEKSLAEDITSRVKGVVEVANYISVGRVWKEKDDREIRKDIEYELRWSSFLDEEDISISVNDGIVILSGVVNSLRDRRLATENAYEGGAKHVLNKLKVRNGPEHYHP